jgi:hypothetical protein
MFLLAYSTNSQTGVEILNLAKAKQQHLELKIRVSAVPFDNYFIFLVMPNVCQLFQVIKT